MQDRPGFGVSEDADLGSLLKLVVQVRFAGLEGVVAGKVAGASVVVSVWEDEAVLDLDPELDSGGVQGSEFCNKKV